MEKYLDLMQHGHDHISICKEMRKDGINIFERIKILRELFPDLSLVEAKEIDVISSGEYASLTEYQEEMMQRILNKKL